MTLSYQDVFNSLQSPHMVLDRDFRYVAANPAYQKVVMRSLDDLLGRNIFDMFPNDGESGRRLRESFQTVLDTGKPDSLAYIPYDIPRAPEQGGGIEQRVWTAVHTPVHDGTGRTNYIIQNSVDVTELALARKSSDALFRQEEAALLERSREVEEAQRHLRAESSEFRRLFQQAKIFLAVLSGPDHIFTFVNDAYSKLIGDRDVMGMRVAAALPEMREQGFFELLDTVYRTGESKSGEGVKVWLKGAEPDTLREAYLDFSYDPIFTAGGTVSGVLVQGMDRTESVRAQERQTLLMHELNHRVKNTLATVQALTTNTLRSHADPVVAARIVEQRIMALAKAHDLVSRNNRTGADLGELIRAELSAYGEERTVLVGPEVTLPPRLVLALSLTLHELATNAAKYGALSNSSGTVTVTWAVEAPDDEKPGGKLRLAWEEVGGPPPAREVTKGFGSRLIKMTVNGELEGEYTQAFEVTGFRAHFIIPLFVDSDT